MRYICAQPSILFYAWQVEVLLNNFIEIGINLNDVDVICSIETDIPNEWKLLSENYSARFFFYKDTRTTKHYISSIRPNILKQHFKEHPYLKDDVIFYHDCDILFTKNPIDWITDEMMNDDKWYGSDTRWYIGHDYIKSKGDDVLKLMTDIVDIPIKTIEDNELNCIGAQYLLKDINWEFWERVELNSERLFNEVSKLNTEKVLKNNSYHELQIWCADMWSVLWNGWKLGKETVVHNNFNFTWATSSISEFSENYIFHNAGVVNNKGGLFYKAKYINKLPYSENLEINKLTSSYEYYKFVKKVSKKSVLINKNK
jgi:hypothetical protein